jgi:tetratricopeptide (TPR) repeat protein
MPLHSLARAVLVVAISGASAPASDGGYLGGAVCAQCHREIAATQLKTNMALTWRGKSATALPAGFTQSKSEGPPPMIEYRLHVSEGGVQYHVTLPGGSHVTAPVEAMVGGKRHGVSFLARLTEIGGVPLARPALIETRYLLSAHQNALVLSPGFPEDKPASFETALGRALAPDFENKCLSCHGRPSAESASGGVHCEACHGPGRAHLDAISHGKSDRAIINPAKLSKSAAMERCAQCHSGFAKVYDPVPDDLLISNQVNALKNSECYIQTDAAFNCMACHDPHNDATDVPAKSAALCRSCHSRAAEKRASLCPVNQNDGCLGCHMPEVRKGSFVMVDHWIRVHPEQGAGLKPLPDALRTTIRPRRMQLRMMVLDSRDRANEVAAKLTRGESFFDLARANSTDPSAGGGGYIGPMNLTDLDPPIADAAARLSYGERSPVIESRGRYLILERLPIDFRWRAEQLEREASRLKAEGRLAEAIGKYEAALRVYPHFLRALIFLGATLGEQGNARRAAGVLEFAARLYPDDPATHYNLGIAYGSLGRMADEAAEYRKALDLQPDLTPAYENLGATLYSAQQLDQAAAAYEEGLRQNPLSSILYYNLSIVREQQGNAEAAKRALALARAIDPQFVQRQRGSAGQHPLQ